MLWPYLNIWEWELIFGRAVKLISSPGVRSPCLRPISSLEMSSQKNERFLGHISSSDSVLSFRMKAGKGSGVKVPLSHSMAFYYFCTTFWLLLTLYFWALNIPHSNLIIELLIQSRNNFLVLRVSKYLHKLMNLMRFICKTETNSQRCTLYVIDDVDFSNPDIFQYKYLQR